MRKPYALVRRITKKSLQPIGGSKERKFVYLSSSAKTRFAYSRVKKKYIYVIDQGQDGQGQDGWILAIFALSYPLTDPAI